MKTSGNKRYTIKYLKHVLKRNLPFLPKDVKPSIKDAIKKYLEIDPIGNGVLLRKRLKGHRRIKVADDYRIVYRVNTAKRIVIIVSIGHRDNIYKQAILDPTETLNIFYTALLPPTLGAAQKMKFFLVQQKQHFEFEKAKYLSLL